MKRFIIALVAVVSMATASAQPAEKAQTGEKKEKKFDFKFYGRVRGDLSLNSRNSQESVDGLFFMYPLDESPDADGHDLNAWPASNFYMLYTRLGVDMKGPNIGRAKTAAKLETDFRGSGGTYSIFRIRQAYVTLDWGRHDVLVGQTWHPLYGDVTPTMLNLSTGAPFGAFSRTPMVRYRWKMQSGLQLTAAAMWQMQYNSPGPENDQALAKSAKDFHFLKNGCVPEVYLALDYKRGGWLAGVGANLLSISPRKTHTFPAVSETVYMVNEDNSVTAVTNKISDAKTYKVSERITTLSAEAHVKYTAPRWNVSAKTTLGQNLAHLSMLGGYAVSGVDATTGQQTYTPYRISSTWVNFVYGKKWQPTFFLGYSKNLGTTKDVYNFGTADKAKYARYGTGLDLDQLLTFNASLSYNLPHWKLGAELEPSFAWYANKSAAGAYMLDSRGRATSTHTISALRAVVTAMYIF